MRVLLDPDSVTRGLRRVAGEIVERHRGTEGLVIIGVRRGGIAIARELVRLLREVEGREIPVGTVDITLYRDDAATALPNPRIGPSAVPVSLAGKNVVLVDDVITTGATAEACAWALKRARAARVDILALARAVEPTAFVL